MKIFNADTSAWPEKVNFVDKNNVVVGYDMSQQCCEVAGWFLTKSLPAQWNKDKHRYDGELDHTALDLEPYVFDPTYYNDRPEQGSVGAFEETSAVAFRLTNGTDELFLVLHNTHNGYYSHGFTVEVGGVKVRDESI